jgi:hypothetical protein
VAVDSSGNEYTYNGSSWAAAQNINSNNSLSQVSCSSASFCVAIDGNADVAVLTGGSWSSGTLSQTATSVSCPSDGYCVAVDQNGGALVYQQGNWSSETKVDGNNSFKSVSCAQPTQCAATDQYDNVMYYTSGG